MTVGIVGEGRFGAIVRIARVCHEANRGYCASIGDMSQPTWEEAPDWQKESALKGVMHHIENPDSTPADSHTEWMAEKARTGWSYGDEKDPEAKTHPCMVPWEELPAEQRMKDVIFLSIVRAMHPRDVTGLGQRILDWKSTVAPSMGHKELRDDLHTAWLIVRSLKEGHEVRVVDGVAYLHDVSGGIRL